MHFRILLAILALCGAACSQAEAHRTNFRPVSSLASDVQAKADKEEEIVYITKSGAKYHAAGCRYLKKSSIPIELSKAKARYGACSVCGS